MEIGDITRKVNFDSLREEIQTSKGEGIIVLLKGDAGELKFGGIFVDNNEVLSCYKGFDGVLTPMIRLQSKYILT